MFSFTRSTVFGFLHLEIKILHSISIILSWLGECVRIEFTVESEIPIEGSRSSNPRENFVHDVVLGHFAFDVTKGFITKGLHLKLGSMCQHHI